VSAHREGETLVVSIPARMSRTEERHWVGLMVARLQQSEARRRPSDEALLERARRLSQKYLDGAAVPNSVAWSTVQRARWGSATPEDGSIRISARLRGAPRFVLDYVLLHELAHLLVPDHGPAFHELLTGYPHRERARGFLEGVTAVVNGELTDPDG
jgi:predicted metal-dependent hydrolase